MSAPRGKFGFIETLIVVCVIALPILVVWRLVLTNARVTEANYERIEIGMTQEEVEAILGSGSPVRSCCLPSPPAFHWRSSRIFRQRYIYVTFAGPEGAASHVSFFDSLTEVGRSKGVHGWPEEESYDEPLDDLSAIDPGDTALPSPEVERLDDTRLEGPRSLIVMPPASAPRVFRNRDLE
jgi:hypothetical protein